MYKLASVAFVTLLTPWLANANDGLPIEKVAIGLIQGGLNCATTFPHLTDKLTADFQSFVDGNRRYFSDAQWKVMERTLAGKLDTLSEEYCRSYFAKNAGFDQMISVVSGHIDDEARVQQVIPEQKGARGVVGVGLDEWATVVQIVPNSPAEKAGLRLGDRMVSVNGQAVRLASDFTLVVLQSAPMAKVRVLVLRNVETLPFELEVTAAEKLSP